MCVRVCACVCVCVSSLHASTAICTAMVPSNHSLLLTGVGLANPLLWLSLASETELLIGKKTKRVCVCVICVFRSRWALVPCLAGVMADLCVCACMCAVVGLHVISQDCAVHAASIHVQYTVRFYSGPPTFCVAGHVLHFSYVCHWSSILKFSYSATSREMPVV